MMLGFGILFIMMPNNFFNFSPPVEQLSG